MNLFYIISMAVAFTNMFTGQLMPFYIKYIIAAIWGLMWLFDIGARRNSIDNKSINALKEYCVPFLYILIWTFVLWCIDKPMNFSSAYVSRVVSNTLYLLLTFVSAIAGVHFFGRSVIKLSAIAMSLSVVTNLIVVISQYGIGTFMIYFPNALDTTNYVFGSMMYNFSEALEVQDITMATGFYLIYFLFFDSDDSKNTKIKYIVLMLLCAYIGFKRTTLFGLLLAGGAIWFVKRKNVKFKNVVYTFGLGYIILATGYVVLVKLNFFEMLMAMLNVDANGRISIYGNLASYYELSPFYLGKGFMYVDKTMYETSSFAAHSVIVRMFAEIGCIPYFIWLYHYLIKVPLRTFNREEKQAGKVAFVTTLYLFATYFMENTMSLFCIQYSFILIPLAIAASERTRSKIRFVIGSR